MNAPWKPAASGNRAPFAAFLCDDASLEVLRPIAADMGWPPEMCNKGGLRNAVQSLSISSSPNILMIDLSESGDPLHDINALAEVCEPGTVVIAAGQVNDVRLYRDLMASGIHDYLLKPLSHGAVRDALMHAQAVFSAPKSHEAASGKTHVATAVIGTRGGVGVSTLATSLAWAFSADYGQATAQTTALFDLDIHFGSGALTLDLEPGRGLVDAIENPSRIDGLFLERAMIRANDRLSILSAEAPISQPLLTDGGAFLHLLEEFRQAFEMTVIDMPRNIMINFPQLLADVNIIVLATELTLAGARDSIRILSWLKAHVPQAQVLVVANKVHAANLEISRADFEASIERQVNILVPFDHKAGAQAARLGQTFVEANRASKAGAAMLEVAAAVRRAGDPETASGTETAVRPSLLGKLDFKALFAGKGAKKAPAKAKSGALAGGA